ncbi:thioredoxin 1 [Metamycoplasma subdolum]|uniref:Thioredoxin 1 n=1 Tax=Metamycoplasma subdolum TaxID=92407 RepID=A0A3M0AIT4_9BACT|nr:thioredoxin family protein [Metamycoplasma subdolum]RMA79022.1 thioredoxin 1 [Metamycoplasma subdolum]WPB50545.1 thioredoxin family protein [Metamycoplasma subdolum]
MQKVNKETLKDQHLQGKSVLVFSADWCHWCKLLKPELKKLEEEYKINVFDVDVDEDREFARENMVQSLPTTFFYQDGKLIGSQLGYLPSEELVKKFN